MGPTLVRVLVGSPRKVTIDPPMPWSCAHASMTAASFTQYTITSSTPSSFNEASCCRYPGTCTVDHVGVKAAGRPVKVMGKPQKKGSTLRIVVVHKIELTHDNGLLASELFSHIDFGWGPCSCIKSYIGEFASDGNSEISYSLWLPRQNKREILRE